MTGFAIDAASGRLTLLNQSSSLGPGPCHLTVDRGGHSLLVANYDGGSVAALPIGADGRLGVASTFVQHRGSSVNLERQASPHAHSIDLDAANRFALVDDLGLDKVLVYRLRHRREAPSNPREPPPSPRLAPGAGSRHLVFHPGRAPQCTL